MFAQTNYEFSRKNPEFLTGGWDLKRSERIDSNYRGPQHVLTYRGLFALHHLAIYRSRTANSWKRTLTFKWYLWGDLHSQDSSLLRRANLLFSVNHTGVWKVPLARLALAKLFDFKSNHCSIRVKVTRAFEIGIPTRTRIWNKVSVAPRDIVSL